MASIIITLILPIIVSIITSVIIIIYSWRLDKFVIWLSKPVNVFLVWLFIFLMPYIIFGPYSFLWMDDEGDLLVPHHLYLAQHSISGLYSHLLASGADLGGSFLVGGEFISPERLLMAVLPLWLAIAVHKALTCAFGFWGTYLVARRMGGCSSVTAAAIAGTYTIWFFRMALVTYSTGTTLSLIPFGLYVLLGRLGQRGWWGGVGIYAAIVALWGNPYEGVAAIFAALLGAMIVLNCWNWRPLAGAAVVGAAVSINWVESFHGIALMMAGATRGATPTNIPPLEAILTIPIRVWQMIYTWPVLLLQVITIAVFGLRLKSINISLWARLILGIAAPEIAFAIFHIFPWELFGIGIIKNAKGLYMTFGISAIISLAVAIIGRHLESSMHSRKFSFRVIMLPGIVGGACAFGLLLSYSITSLTRILGSSGQAHYQISNLANPTWLKPAPLRTISIRASYLQPEPSVLFGAYGLAIFDAFLNALDQRHFDYWTKGVLSGGDPYDPRLGMNWALWRDGTYYIEEQANLRLLAAANVGYIVSALPLTGAGLTLLDGPERPPLVQTPSRDFSGLLAYYGERVRRIFDLGKMYVYGVADPLPRIWAARDVVTVAGEVEPNKMLAEVARVSADKTIVATPGGAEILGRAHNMDVLKFELIPNGFTADIDAPDGGILVVNAVASRYFQADVDGIGVPIVPVSGVQTAMAIPKGGRHARLCFRRPVLFPALQAPVTGECGIGTGR